MYYCYYPFDICIETNVIQFGKAITPVIFLIVVLFSCVGNTLVLWVLVKYENLKSLNNTLLLNLALSDLIFTFGLPFWAHYYMYGWTLGDPACKAVNFVFYTGYYSSSIFLTVLTVHCYMATDFAGEINWILASTYLQNSFFVIAFVIIAFCYTVILGRLISHTRRKTVQLILFIVVFFFLGWGPYNMAIFLDSLISWNISPFSDCELSKSIYYWKHISQMVAFSHCCLNPVFYVFMGTKFRNRLKKILPIFCKNNTEVQNRYSMLDFSNGEEISMF
ncbi:chemokine XC receptor 1-like [Carassius carassius]|uniref:chemokine XC receptor 1-like n=1 Tax=Carassius carassius TaxID=217509 RepID=UPI002868B77E|nr:chemokine XC receptor 1-like [Carassius carassius]